MGSSRFKVNLIASVISHTTSILIAFFLTPFLVENLGIEVYGFYPLANNFVIFMYTISLALNSMASRYITIEMVRGNKDNVNKLYSSIFISNIILTILLALPMIVIVIFLNFILDIPSNLVNTIKILFTLIFTSLIINILTTLFSVATYAKNRLDLRAFSEIIQAILKGLLFVVLFTIFPPTIIFVGIVILIVNSINMIIQYTYTKKLMPDIHINYQNYSIPLIKKVLSSGIWNSINYIGSHLMYSIDLLVANIMLGAHMSGQLSIVHIVPGFINGFITMLTNVFLPSFTYKFAENDFAGLIKEVRQAQNFMIIITTIPISIFIAFGVDFFRLWIPESNASYLQLLSIMTIVHLIVVGAVWPIANLNTIMNRVKLPSLLMVGCGLLNIISMVIFLTFTNHGLIIIPITTMIISIIWFGVFIPIYPCKKLNVSIFTFYPPIVKSVISSLIIIGISLFIKSYFIIDSWYMLLLLGGVCGILALFINLILNKKGLNFFTSFSVKKV